MYFLYKSDRFMRFCARGFYEFSCISLLSCYRSVIIGYRFGIGSSLSSCNDSNRTLYSEILWESKTPSLCSLALGAISLVPACWLGEWNNEKPRTWCNSSDSGNGNRSIARITASRRTVSFAVRDTKGARRAAGNRLVFRGNGRALFGHSRVSRIREKEKEGEGRARERERERNCDPVSREFSISL